MRHKTYICIDDTDEIGYEKSTGEISEEIREFVINNFSEASFVTRHQLFIHEDIPYTSHNSSMCFTTMLSVEEKQQVIDYICTYVLEVSAESSAPGVCVCFEKDIKYKKLLIKYSIDAKNEVVAIDDAFAMAEKQNIFLKALRENRQGVVGALAGVGLRLYGDDGRVKGKLKIEKEKATAKEIKESTLVQRVILENRVEIFDEKEIVLTEYLKPVYLDHKYTLIVEEFEDGYRVLSKEKLKKY